MQGQRHVLAEGVLRRKIGLLSLIRVLGQLGVLQSGDLLLHPGLGFAPVGCHLIAHGFAVVGQKDSQQRLGRAQVAQHGGVEALGLGFAVVGHGLVVIAVLHQQRVPAIGSVFRVIVGMATAGFVHRPLALELQQLGRAFLDQSVQYRLGPYNGVTGIAGILFQLRLVFLQRL